MKNPLNFFRRKQNERHTVDTETVDQESRQLWRSLETAGSNCCCHYMRLAVKHWDLAVLVLTLQKKHVADIRIKYCPECGRKL